MQRGRDVKRQRYCGACDGRIRGKGGGAAYVFDGPRRLRLRNVCRPCAATGVLLILGVEESADVQVRARARARARAKARQLPDILTEPT